MKRIYRFISLILLISIYSTPIIALIQNEADLSQDVVRVYDGKVLSGDSMMRVKTTFVLRNKKRYMGSYIIFENSELVLGELLNFRRLSKQSVLMEWKDKYGTGILQVHFSKDFKTFHGYWSNGKEKPSLPWTGILSDK